MTETITLNHLDAATARPRFEELVVTYLDAQHSSDPFYGEDRYRRQLSAHMDRPGWHMVTAEVDGELAGYIYGFPAPANGRTWEGLTTPLPADFIREDGRRTFALCELLVRPTWRRRHIAKALHDEILTHRTEERANLLARPDNTAAQAAYAAWGWQKVAQLVPGWENSPVFDVLILALPQQEPK